MHTHQFNGHFSSKPELVSHPLDFLSPLMFLGGASEFDLSCTGLLEHSIELSSNKPVRQALRRHPVAYLPLIDDYGWPNFGAISFPG